MQNELNGHISVVLHPRDDGFIVYKNEEGEDVSIYFRGQTRYLGVRSKKIWQIGDEVTFTIKELKGNRRRAEVHAFNGNKNLDSLLLLSKENPPYLIKGFLKVFEAELYFQELKSGLLFQVMRTTPSDISITDGKEYDALLDVRQTPRYVTLVDWIKLHEECKLCRQQRKTKKGVIVGIMPEYLQVQFSDTDILGKVIGFDRGKNYLIGEELEVNCFADKPLRISFADVDYRKAVNNESYLPELDRPYKAVVTGASQNVYEVELIGTDYVGIMLFNRARGELERFEVNDIIDVYFHRRTGSRQLLFWSAKQHSTIKEKTNSEL